ncbi:hypothetical protein ES704_01600 [subsurface metagenome]
MKVNTKKIPGNKIVDKIKPLLNKIRSNEK